MAEEACRAPHSADREGHDAGWLSCTYPPARNQPPGPPRVEGGRTLRRPPLTRGRHTPPGPVADRVPEPMSRSAEMEQESSESVDALITALGDRARRDAAHRAVVASGDQQPRRRMHHHGGVRLRHPAARRSGTARRCAGKGERNSTRIPEEGVLTCARAWQFDGRDGQSLGCPAPDRFALRARGDERLGERVGRSRCATGSVDYTEPFFCEADPRCAPMVAVRCSLIIADANRAVCSGP